MGTLLLLHKKPPMSKTKTSKDESLEWAKKAYAKIKALNPKKVGADLDALDGGTHDG